MNQISKQIKTMDKIQAKFRANFLTKLVKDLEKILQNFNAKNANNYTMIITRTKMIKLSMMKSLVSLKIFI